MTVDLVELQELAEALVTVSKGPDTTNLTPILLHLEVLVGQIHREKIRAEPSVAENYLALIALTANRKVSISNILNLIEGMRTNCEMSEADVNSLARWLFPFASEVDHGEYEALLRELQICAESVRGKQARFDELDKFRRIPDFF